MSKRFCRVLSFLLTVMFLSAMLPIGAAASAGEEALPEFDISAEEDGSLRLWGYYGTGGDVVIPDGVKTITSGQIFEQSGYGDSITSVHVPESVTMVWGLAFNDLPNLTSVTILNGATEFEDRFFPGADGNVITVNVFSGSSPDLTIYSVPGGTVEAYAQKHGINFVALDATAQVPPVTAPQPPAATTVTAIPTPSTVLVNGESTAFEAYSINDNNYFKLRDLAFVLNGTTRRFEVGFDDANNAISLTSGQPYTVVGGEMNDAATTDKAADSTTSRIYLDGVEISLTAYNIDGSNFFKLRDVMQVFNVFVGYDEESEVITVDTGSDYVSE